LGIAFLLPRVPRRRGKAERGKMFNLGLSDPLDKPLSEAQGIAAERAKILEAIQGEESNLSGLEEKLAAARGVVTSEEFAAAQVEGGLAIASKAAQQAVAEAELRVKSAKFRLQGLRNKLSESEKKLLSVWRELEEHRDEFLRRQIAELDRQFDAEVEAVIHLLSRAKVLRRYCTARHEEKYNFHFRWGQEANFPNPIGRNGNFIRGDMFRIGGKNHSMNNHWADDPDAVQLNSKIEAILESMAPIGSIAKEIGGEQG